MVHHSWDRLPLRWPRRVPLRPAVLFASLLALVLLLPNPAFAHGALKSATPGEGDTLSVAPGELRLTFTEAVELAVSRLDLTGPNGPVALAALALDPDSATVLVGAIEGRLVPGTYTVNWQAVGADGHPVRGQYSFIIESGARGLTMAENSAATQAPTPAAPTNTNAVGTVTPESTGSSTLAWLIAAVVLGIIGVVGFQLFGRRPQPEDAGEDV
ncbi:MAG TPA: copper resistance protein CopC [Longimicrobiaceae bacterium]|nr:copper resistance protein CopC [Longimicrobiaceae bacterium]